MKRIQTALLLMMLLSLLVTSCGTPPEPTAAILETSRETGYLRMFTHSRTENMDMPFADAVVKAGTVVTATLSASELTSDGYYIHTFQVKDSLANPDNDTEIHLYEGPDAKGNNPYESGKTYLLVLSRATDVYYPHPYFHNFSGVQIAADAQGRILQAVARNGLDNLKTLSTTRSTMDTLAHAAQWIQDQRNAATSPEKGSFRYTGRDVGSDNPDVLVANSDAVLAASVVSILVENRLVRVANCRVDTLYKGEEARTVTVLFPLSAQPAVGDKFLLFLNQDGEYRISSQTSVLRLPSPAADTAMNAIRSFLAIRETPEPTPVPATATPRSYALLDDMKPHMEQYPDLKGWFRIPGTVIDYPVVESTDNDYYLAHGPDKEKSVSGSIELDYRVDIKNLTQNTPIYGHNMKRGTMFHALVNYKTKKFYEEHPVITFNTLYDKQEWEVFSVHVVDSGYNYVITMDFKDDADYQKFLDDITKRSMYPAPFTVTPKDKIITMVTCSYEFDGARTIIHARLKTP